jgi:hypothetical protein
LHYFVVFCFPRSAFCKTLTSLFNLKKEPVMAQTVPSMPEQPTAAPKPGMSNTAKIVLGLLAVLGLCCIVSIIAAVAGGAWFTSQVEQGLVDDPEQAAEAGQSIVNYELPAGYREDGAINLLGLMEMVFITQGSTNTDEDMVIFLARFSIPGLSESDTDEMKEQMQQGFSGGSSSGGVSYTEVDSREITINGEPTTLTISEGESDGNTFRQAAAGFVSDGKPAMVMIMGPADAWDEDAVEEFLASLE